MTDPLPLGLTADALAAAGAEADPGSLAAATRMRARFGPELSAAALNQVALRRRARTKFGAAADELFLTRDGLEQATRPELAAHHADRLRAAGAARVVDLGCGIGTDARAFLDAGLEVLAVERDPVTAAVARANLAGRAEVACADAEEAVARLRPGDAVWLDPARRDARGRTWRLEDLSPPWTLVTALLDGKRVAGAKLGPALPHGAIPASCEAEWVSLGTETVEVALWAGDASEPGLRTALVWPDARLEVRRQPTLDVSAPGRYLYEPAGAVIRAGGVGQLGEDLGARLLDPHIAYLTADERRETPFATAFAVLEVLPYDRGTLRRRLRERGIGSLEVKRRGLDVDPAELRRRLAPRGPSAATLLLSRAPAGAVAVLAQRC